MPPGGELDLEVGDPRELDLGALGGVAGARLGLAVRLEWLDDLRAPDDVAGAGLAVPDEGCAGDDRAEGGRDASADGRRAVLPPEIVTDDHADAERHDREAEHGEARPGRSHGFVSNRRVHGLPLDAGSPDRGGNHLEPLGDVEPIIGHHAGLADVFGAEDRAA